MKRKPCTSLFMTGMMAVAALVLQSCTSGWPQFRGAEADMIVHAKDLPTEWGDDMNIGWTYGLTGGGWSSPVVWGDRIFITTAFPEKIAPRPGEETDSEQRRQVEERAFLQDVYRWEVTCLDLSTGSEIWKKVARRGNPRIRKHRNTTYASETPVTDGKRLYVYFGMTGLYCYDLDGVLLWEKDLGAYETQNNWGTGSSPVVYKDMLFVQVDNEVNSFLVALDAATGDELWRVDRDEKTNYSTPYIWENSKRTELVVGGNRLRSYDPETGDLYWELLAKGRYSIPSPVSDRDHLYVGNTQHRDIPGTLFAVKGGVEGDITPAEGESSSNGVSWSLADAPTGNPSPLLYEGLLYLVSSRGGEVTCFDAATGEVVYQEDIDGVGACWASPWIHNDRIYFLDERGVTSVFRTGREFELLSQNTLDDKFWASVAVAPGAYLLKGVDRLYCIRNEQLRK